jgi:cyclopropane fatty-acyl-phospholipid synthase-like methyltransferase
MADAEARRMQQDWNQRATEDAYYYVAFGRRNQSDGEFFETAREQVHGLELELKRLPPARPQTRRALEIGCGPGRLMRPLAHHFGEIHGVDISDEMVRRAQAILADIPHAHAHHASHSDLRAFASESFDFVYSYAVFQHIPSRNVVLGYLRESWRVLKPSGILRCQINGLPQTARHYDTWSGVRLSAPELRSFAHEQGFLLLALEGAETQYMWATLRRPPAPNAPPACLTRIRRITNAFSSEPVVPVRGRFAALSLWVEGLAPQADLNSLALSVGGRPAFLTYLGPPEPDSLQQLNALLPEGLQTGLEPVEVTGCPRSWVRLIPAGPPVPRILSVTDGIDLLSGSRIVTSTVKITVEEVLAPEAVSATVGGFPVAHLESFCTDPRLPRHEFNFRLPDSLGTGTVDVTVMLGPRILGSIPVEISEPCNSAT